MTSERPTAAAHRVIREAVGEGDLVVDATAGNGHDTLFLAGLVGEKGRVIAYDIQKEAIDSTRRRLVNAGVDGRVELRNESHARMPDRVERGSVSAVMFNLGYLPGGDHSIITEIGESGKAVMDGLMALAPGGVMTVVCYPGHRGGDVESAAIVEALRMVRADGTVGAFELKVGEPARDGAPFLVVVRR